MKALLPDTCAASVADGIFVSSVTVWPVTVWEIGLRSLHVVRC